MALPLEIAPLMARFLGAMIDLKEAFRGFFFWEEILSVKTHILMKASICSREFPLRIIERSIHTTSENMGLVHKRPIINTTQKIDEDKIFLHGHPI